MKSSKLPLSMFIDRLFGPSLTVSSREQIQNARENPLAAAAAAAAVSGNAPPPPTQGNVENLLDIDFDGTAPASAQKEPDRGLSGLEGLAGTPTRVESPAAGAPAAAPAAAPPAAGAPAQSNNMDDLLGVFGDGGSAGPASGAPDTNGSGTGASGDLMNGFAGLDLSSNTTSPPPGGNQPKKTNEDIMSLF